MLDIGRDNQLKILRSTKIGLYLGNDAGDEVLLPEKYVPKHYEIGEEVTVFVYLDHEERPVATTLEPYVYRDEFALLRVNHINQFGAFVGIGLEKDLFVPFAEQPSPLEKGKRYLIYMYLDEKSGRLVGSAKTNRFLDNSEVKLSEGEQVDLIVSHKSEAGINVIVNEKYKGLLYENEVFDDAIRPGDRMTGYVKRVRDDKKLDIALQPPGYAAVESNAESILEALRASNGFLRLTDDSHPDDIKALLKMSKKTFKKAVGSLYKQRLIEMKPDGIYLAGR
jgi:predicted RNA-binding protein (virulence factor B family)